MSAKATPLLAVAINKYVCYETVNFRNCQDSDGPLSAETWKPSPYTAVGHMLVFSVGISTGA